MDAVKQNGRARLIVRAQDGCCYSFVGLASQYIVVDSDDMAQITKKITVGVR